MTNASKYSSEGSEIIITVIKPATSSKLIISVKDSGMGIPPAEQKNIFKKMYRANNARKAAIQGTGLGLYITKSIVNTAGGRIWFESDSEKGTTFYVELPASGMQKRAGEKSVEEMNW